MRIDRELFRGLDALRVASALPSTGARPGERRSRLRGRGLDIADYRPYAPGDDLRLVDWNAYARLEAVLVKLFHEDRDLVLAIVVDASASMGFGAPRKLDHAGELAACLAYLALRARERVRLAIAGGRGGHVRGDHVGSLGTIVSALERAEATGAPDLPAALAGEAQRGRTDHAVLLSDLLVEPEVREATLRRLAALARRPVLLHVLGDTELAPVLDGGVVVDAETGEALTVRGGRAAREAYAAELARFRAEIEARCAALGILYAPAVTAVPARALLAGELRRLQLTESARGAGR